MGSRASDGFGGPLRSGDVVLNRYRVREAIARGGYSVVYRGTDERLARPVSIKVFHRLAAEPGIRRTSYEHFVQEAFALSLLTHPNTLRIFDFGDLSTEPSSPPVPFQVSEYAAGGTLNQFVRDRGPRPAAEVVATLAMVCGALTEAHRCGIVHRDIKPQNVLLAKAGKTLHPKLADFGIAKVFPSEQAKLRNRANETSVTAGKPLGMYSPGWAAPEQLLGAPIGTWCDIYSLAMTAVFMLTGQRPPRSDPGDCEAHRAVACFVEEALTDASVSASAIDVLRRACHFDPMHRPDDAMSFADELRSALLPTRAEPRPVPRARGTPAPSAATEWTAIRSRTTTIAGGSVVDGDVRPRMSAMAFRREFRSIAAPQGVAELKLPCGEILRLTWRYSDAGWTVHMRTKGCLVCVPGGRPTRAIEARSDTTIELTTPRSELIDRISISFGQRATPHLLFMVDDATVAVDASSMAEAVLVDTGVGRSCYIVYQPLNAAGRR